MNLGKMLDNVGRRAQAMLGVTKGGRLRAVHPNPVFGPHQSQRERSRRIRQMVEGKVPFSQMGGDPLLTLQQARQGYRVGGKMGRPAA